ncbi:MAG TPA: 4-vinyl reductase [Thermoanaerobaculia bacterium]|jgi:predicted hydrocarbon binding protein|nr:4-vinyl reductase [Thermoanaerobaculia bacterium]
MALREVLAGGRIKGGVIRAHLDWLRRHHGEPAVANLVRSLPAGLSAEINSALPSSWCSFESVVTLDRAIAQQYGKNVLKDLGRFSAKINLDTTYRLFKREDIHEFFRRSAALHAQFMDFGTAVYEQSGDHGGRMVHSGYPCFSPTFCASAIGYYEEAIRIHGGRNVIVTESSCQCAGDASCTFVLRWS